MKAAYTYQPFHCETAEVTAHVSGGTPPYIYVWPNGGQDSVSTVPLNQAFVLSVYDAHYCYFADSAVFTCTGN